MHLFGLGPWGLRPRGWQPADPAACAIFGTGLIAPGDRVETGDPLGAVGNSGASTEPHLHVHARRPAAEGGAADLG